MRTKIYIKRLPTLDAPDPSNSLTQVKDNITPIDVEIITNQKKLDVKLKELRLG